MHAETATFLSYLVTNVNNYLCLYASEHKLGRQQYTATLPSEGSNLRFSYFLGNTSSLSPLAPSVLGSGRIFTRKTYCVCGCTCLQDPA